jgi:aminoglycoside phosphotransferase
VTSRTAEVFALSDSAILKLFRDGWTDTMEREAYLARLVQATGTPCPAVLGSVERDGRSGIIYSRLYGPSLQSWLGLRRPWRMRQAAGILAKAHVDLHRYYAPSLPSLHDMLERDIHQASDLPHEIRSRALAVLEALPDGDTLCHGDLTPDNILLTPDGPVVIDWAEAARCDPAADVARTLIHFAVAYTYHPLRSHRLLARPTNDYLSALYLRHYQQVQPDVAARARLWLLPVAAARFTSGAPTPHEVLLRFITRVALVQRMSR